jgi:hypothetical protein
MVLGEKKIIFGLGLGKTGTHSLCRAMEILGYRSKHHPHGKNLNKWIEQYDFLNDLIIAWQYEFLDSNYPDSRFILCYREIEDWIESYQNTEISHGSFFTRQSRFMLYGRQNFDDYYFRKAHEKYYFKVFKYFAKRKNDLLVMNLGDGWEKLCKWLGRDVPDRPYPHLGSWKTRKEREWMLA